MKQKQKDKKDKKQVSSCLQHSMHLNAYAMGIYCSGSQQISKNPIRCRLPSAAIAADAGFRLFFSVICFITLTC